MVSQSVGAKRVGKQLVSLRRADVPGMDARSIKQLIEEPQLREELSFDGGLELLEHLANRLRSEGAADDEETRSLVAAARHFRSQLARLDILPEPVRAPTHAARPRRTGVPKEVVVDLASEAAPVLRAPVHGVTIGLVPTLAALHAPGEVVVDLSYLVEGA
jgi:hypothetical protein